MKNKIIKSLLIVIFLFTTSFEGNQTNEKSYNNTHIATWYNLHGKKTASGEIFNKNIPTAAYNFAKLGTHIKITNLSNGKSIIVKVNDRIPSVKNKIDLSRCAFDSLSDLSIGRIKVKLEIVY